MIADLARLDDILSEPPPRLLEAFGRLSGDILVLGAGGKMGPTLCRMARRAADDSGTPRRVIGVSVAWTGDAYEKLQSAGVETVQCDLMDPDQLDALPDAPNIIYMVGMKFGTTGQESLTWAINAYLPGPICHRYRDSRIVAFSTGNVYALTPVTLGGSIESDETDPRGEYAMSALGRERVFEHFSRALGTPVTIFRLNYAVEMRYGVLVDIAAKVWNEEPVDVTMGNANVIWQGDASAMALQALEHAASPPFVVNAAGPELLSVRRVAQQFGQLMGKTPRIEGVESDRALLSNGQMGHKLYGYPRVTVPEMMQWIAVWTMSGGESLGKPTHFEVSDGRF